MLQDAIQPRLALSGGRPPAPPQRAAMRAVARERWAALAAGAAEPNPFYLPIFALRAEAFARGLRDVDALTVPGSAGLAAFLPVVSAWRALKLPVPALVGWESYAPLTVPLLDAAQPVAAAEGLLDAAAATGAAALYLSYLPLERPAGRALAEALARRGLSWTVLRHQSRAWLDATTDAETMLREALGTKKFKELRRLRNRLEDIGPVRFAIAQGPAEVSAALEHFLALEAAGWKGQRGTALACDEGDLIFIRDTAVTLAARGQCALPLLWAGDRLVAAGLVLRQNGHASFLKIAYDETLARLSPGVQLTLELTRHFCADPDIQSVDSTAIPDHPMIDHLWKDREPFGAVLLPLSRPGWAFAATKAALTFRMTARSRAAKAVRAARAAFSRSRQP